MNVWVENRGCVATTSAAQVELFWTVNRTFEPWSRDWFNYQNNSFSASNFVTYTDASGTKKYPSGNQITIKDKADYYSENKPVNIPAGIQPTMTDRNINEDYIGGFLTSVEWNPPLPEWYMQSASNFHWHTDNEPTLCYLAVITEPSKPNDGFLVPEPRATSFISISDYAINNNNVALVNSYLATPTGSYKRAADVTGKYWSNTGTIFVNNPFGLEEIRLSFIGRDNPNLFSQNGAVYLIFDDLLWDRWAKNNSSGEGEGFEVVEERVIKITNYTVASISGIELDDTEQGMLGVMFEYDGNHVPQQDYYYSFSLGAWDQTPQQQTGDPSFFSTKVLHQPQAEQGQPSSRAMGMEAAETIIDYISAFPNPVNDKLNISYTLKSDSKLVTVEIFDLLGKKIQSSEIKQVKKGMQDYMLDTSSLPPGNYVVKFTAEGSYKTFKIMK
jgi:hypothetical protein